MLLEVLSVSGDTGGQRRKLAREKLLVWCCFVAGAGINVMGLFWMCFDSVIE